MYSFRKFLESYNPGSFLNTAQNGFDNQFFGIGKSLQIPTPTLELPTKTLKGIVKRIVYNQDPIQIQLDTGAIWNLTKQQWDYMKFSNKEPKINSSIQITTSLDGTIQSVDVTHQKYNPTSKPKPKKPDKIEKKFGMNRPF